MTFPSVSKPVSNHAGEDPLTVLAVPLKGLHAREVDPDIALVRAISDGDRAALAALYARHGGRILTSLIGRLGERALAEEVLQDVMLAAWRSAGSFRADSKVLTWLLTIAHNRAINARRRKRVEQTEFDPGLIDGRRDQVRADRADRTADHIDLRRAVHRLPHDQQAALELVFFHGLTIDETAEVLNTAAGTIKSRLHRAKAMLRERLDPEDAPNGRP